MCSLCRLLLAKNHNFGQILTFGGPCTDPLLPMRAKFSVLEQTHGVRLPAKFPLDRFILSPSGGEKKFFAVFWTSVFSGVANWQQSEKGKKVKLSTQLQTFPYPTASKSFLYSNAFMAKSGTQTLTFKSVTDRQTDKKTQCVWLPRRQVF